MADSIINIVNRARGRVGFIPLQTGDFDSSSERAPLEARNYALRNLKQIEVCTGEDQKIVSDVTTAASVNEYTLPCAPNRLGEIQVYSISASDDDDIPLIYQTEKQIKQQYNGDFTEIPEGDIYGWFLKTTSTPADKRLAFVNVPDGVYTIRFWHYVDITTTITSTALTTWDAVGDIALEDMIYADIEFSNGNLSLAEAKAIKDQASSMYIAKDLHVNKEVKYGAPYQQGSNGAGGISYTRTGTAFV